MKMIEMYQKAFSEIISFKNQYMNQIMEMREGFTKERELIQAYELMNMQQKNEIMRLTAVSNHLQTMAFNASDTFKKTNLSFQRDQSVISGPSRGGSDAVSMKNTKNGFSMTDLEKMMNSQVQENLDSLLKDQLYQVQAMTESQKVLKNAF